MIKRVIPSVEALAPADMYQASPPAAVMRDARVSGFVGVLKQLQALATHGSDVLRRIIEDTRAVEARVGSLRDRMDALRAEIGPVDSLVENALTDKAVFAFGHADADHAPALSYPENLLTPSTRDSAVKAAYEACDPAPDWSLFSDMVPDMTPFRARFSDPQLGARQWQFLHQRTLRVMEADARRRAKKAEENRARRASNMGAVQSAAAASALCDRPPGLNPVCRGALLARSRGETSRDPPRSRSRR